MDKHPLQGSPNSGFRVRKSQLGVNLAVAAISLCLSLGLAELVLRSFIPLVPVTPAEFRIPHPVLGWVLQPDATYRYQMPEATVTVKYNSKGWRDLERTQKRPEGIFRIVVLGDSFMEATAVELNDAFHMRVEELARDSGRDVEVINLSVAGYGTLQEYLVFQDIGRLYDPDLVLLGFFGGNDVMNNSLELESTLGADRMYTLARPFLDPNEPTLWKITPVDFETVQRKYEKFQSSLDPQRLKPMERLIVLRLAREAIKKVLEPESPDDQEADPQSVDRERLDIALLGEYYCEEPPAITRAWDTTERILSKLKAAVEEIGAKLVVFSVPALEDVSVEYMNEVTSNSVNPNILCMEEAPGHARLSMILTKLDIEQISMLSDFRRVQRTEGIQLYRLSDLHWNPEGHALAAERVVSELIKRGLLPMGSH